MALTAAGTTKVDLEEAENASLDRRILALETELRKLKREKNDRAKVSRLPDEVLCAIFLFLAEDMKASHRMGRITWTCAVALALDLGSEVASGTTCHQHTSRPQKRDDALKDCNLLKQESHRLRLVDIYTTHDLYPSLVKWLVGSAPQLERVSIRIIDTDGSWDLQGPIISRPTNLPRDFLNGNAPKLRELVCKGCLPFFSGSISNFVNLTKLHIEMDTFHSSGRDPLPTEEQVVETLSRMPGLVHLELRLFRPLANEASIVMSSNVGRRPPMPLPRLTHLSLASSCLSIASLLEHLHLPASMNLTLWCNYADENSIGHLADALRSSWISLPLSTSSQTPSQLPVEQLDLGLNPLGIGFHVEGSAFDESTSHEKIAATFSIAFISRTTPMINNPNVIVPWRSALTRLAVSPWPLNRVKEVIISSPRLTAAGSDWIDESIFLGPFPALTTVSLEQCSGNIFMDVLLADPVLDVEAGQGNLPVVPRFPLLRELTFIDMPRRFPGQILCLADICAARAYRGCPIETVHFVGCSRLIEEDIEQLNSLWEVVPFVCFR
ncbi:hypothetical protein CC1G_08854 [Coprinopsis cinerea okayama7|uniref:F-box domain-containing protein n=1 Tax=Coprinopsis cinerea (strain Okayama-7 / 130 / ATCC MYA-4618 / FGSC 9003) TaxID=240176 RepID=A8P6C5_COPC7|nr:hypothetical protein CC1G_08854 [Coprinopsis cinerea okayama7\|eukprot:XP_001839128.1 hypothetical protein CC1G_08854 [Coprinopsis cinerea okayama7\